MQEFYMNVLKLARIEGHYELDKRWALSQGYSLSHANELP